MLRIFFYRPPDPTLVEAESDKFLFPWSFGIRSGKMHVHLGAYMLSIFFFFLSTVTTVLCLREGDPLLALFNAFHASMYLSVLYAQNCGEPKFFLPFIIGQAIFLGVHELLMFYLTYLVFTMGDGSETISGNIELTMIGGVQANITLSDRNLMLLIWLFVLVWYVASVLQFMLFMQAWNFLLQIVEKNKEKCKKKKYS